MGKTSQTAVTYFFDPFSSAARFSYPTIFNGFTCLYFLYALPNCRNRWLFWHCRGSELAGRPSGQFRPTTMPEEPSIPTIRQGIKEIQTGEAIENGRVRKAGGG